MTNFYPKLLVSALVAFTSGMTAQAGDADFSANGIYYNILSEEEKTVEVTWPDETFLTRTLYTREPSLFRPQCRTAVKSIPWPQ